MGFFMRAGQRGAKHPCVLPTGEIRDLLVAANDGTAGKQLLGPACLELVEAELEAGASEVGDEDLHVNALIVR